MILAERTRRRARGGGRRAIRSAAVARPAIDIAAAFTAAATAAGLIKPFQRGDGRRASSARKSTGRA